MSYTVSEIASHIGAALRGDGQSHITGIAPLRTATAEQISFLDNPLYQRYLKDTQAAAVILSADMQPHCKTLALVVDEPYVAYAKAAALFVDPVQATHFIHPTAHIDPSAKLGNQVSIGAHCVIHGDVTVGDGVHIEAGCVVGKHSHIGAQTHLCANVTVYHGVRIGERCLLHSGAVIGSDGFGIAKEGEKWLKVPQLGGVCLGDDVDIGANTTIDRGALNDTVIGDDVKIDNLVQIAHNVQIGDHTAIAGCTGIAGSTTIGEHCLIGGGVCITGHIEITDYVMITGMSGVHRSIESPGVYASGLELQPAIEAKRNAVRYKKLSEMAKKIIELEKQLNKLKRGNLQHD